MGKSQLSDIKTDRDFVTAQKATINMLGTPEDDDAELLSMMYEIIKEERARGRNMQHKNFVVDHKDST